MTDPFFIIAALLFIPYALLIIFFAWGWRNTPTLPPDADHAFVSVIVAMRNEATNIPVLLRHLAAQQYPPQLFEVIIADDHSHDHSASVVAAFVSGHPHFRLIRNTGQSGKKAALQMALRHARGSIIIATDADCTMGPDWLATMAAPLLNKQVQMVIGPVHMKAPQKSLFGKMQSTEFMSLTGVTGGTAYWKQPILCNGANLAYRKQAALKVQTTVSGKKMASGDDVFLLHALKKHYPGGVVFCKNSKAVVNTLTAKTITAFFRQRMRWASKSTAFKDPFTLITGFLVAGFNLWFSISVVWALLVAPELFIPLLWLWGLRFITDGWLLWEVAGFLQKRALLGFYPFLQLLYPFYSGLTIILSLIFPNRWKNRKI